MRCSRRRSLAALGAATAAAVLVPTVAFLPSLETRLREPAVRINPRAAGIHATATTYYRPTRLFGLLPQGGKDDPEGGDGDGDASGNNDEEDVKAARKRLEAMMAGSSAPNDPSNSDSSDKTVSSVASVLGSESVKPSRQGSALDPSNVEQELLNPPPLTTIGRQRCEAEIACLASLSESDDGLSSLWTLWFGERGPGAAKELSAAEQLSMGGPAFWDDSEEQLRSLIDEHGVHWVEPVNRLATLLYQEGRLEESKELCEVVLAVKPWHFGALSGIVLVCAGLSDINGARMWADRRLPPLTPDGTDSNRRVEWVERMVVEASKSLERAEDQVRQNFNKCDEEKEGNSTNSAAAAADQATSTRSSTEISDEDGEDAWQ